MPRRHSSWSRRRHPLASSYEWTSTDRAEAEAIAPKVHIDDLGFLCECASDRSSRGPDKAADAVKPQPRKSAVRDTFPLPGVWCGLAISLQDDR